MDTLKVVLTFFLIGHCHGQTPSTPSPTFPTTVPFSTGQATTPAQPRTLTITTKPGAIILGLTKFLDVGCRIQGPLEGGYRKLVSLVISRKDKLSGRLEEVVSVSAFSPDEINVLTPTRGIATAHLNETGDSTLALHWLYPAEIDSGFYECEASVLDDVLHPIMYRANHTVRYFMPSLPTLVDHFRQLEIELDALKGRISSATDSMFVSSGDIEGKTYYISRFPYVNVDRAETACNLVNGHLVEIQNQTEFDNITTFLKSPAVKLPASKEVLIGLSDEATENQWVYRHSGELVSFKPWFTNEPNGGTSYNCAILDLDTSKYYDYACAGAGTAHFLCESY